MYDCCDLFYLYISMHKCVYYISQVQNSRLVRVFSQQGFTSNSAGKESPCNAGDSGLIPGSGRSPGEGIGYPLQHSWAFLVAQTVKKSTCSAEHLGSIPGLGRSPREGNSYPLQCSGLKESLAGYSPCGHKESDTTEWLWLLCKRHMYLLCLAKKKARLIIVQNWES